MEDAILKVIPNLTDSVHDVCSCLLDIGVESTDDLSFVKVEDLMPVVSTIQARKLVKSWSGLGKNSSIFY